MRQQDTVLSKRQLRVELSAVGGCGSWFRGAGGITALLLCTAMMRLGVALPRVQSPSLTSPEP